jgi:sterol desaturase/sphingolipid hydroxylase (fatty acid hydroxylase superfamily)
MSYHHRENTMFEESFNTIFIIGFIIFCFGLEYLSPRSKHKTDDRFIIEDGAWFILNEFLLTVLFGYSSYYIGHNLSIYLDSLSINLSSINIVFQFIIFLLYTDMLSYFAHFFVHRNKYLRLIHKTHHSVKFLNPLSTFRHSIPEKFYFSVFIGSLNSLLVVSPGVRELVFIIINSTDIFQHANIKLKIPYFLNYIFIFPDNHLYHHSKTNLKPYGQNFGLLFSCWDILFRTFYLPKEEINVEVGLTNDSVPKNLFKRALFPIFSSKKERSNPIL